MHQGNGCSAKTLGKSVFHYQTDWSDNGPAGQFCQMESTLRLSVRPGGDSHISDGDARRKNQIKPLRETSVGVAQALTDFLCGQCQGIFCKFL